jgi:hypothetical protein
VKIIEHFLNTLLSILYFSEINRRIFSNSLFKRKRKAGSMAQVVECLPTNCKALSSIFSTVRKKRNLKSQLCTVLWVNWIYLAWFSFLCLVSIHYIFATYHSQMKWRSSILYFILFGLVTLCMKSGWLLCVMQSSLLYFLLFFVYESHIFSMATLID